ncbi:conserved hypothetical protein [Trichinella spiralis]|uniref:hypothetical protein n=1 Tax=Trichinella spiralis TaxID=6334 RepID=UPI0001EFB284|nr:conserved hypothetical protein [Trichinella spiralis]
MHFNNVKNAHSDSYTFQVYIMQYYDNTHNSVGGSVVECSPATRATRVRFPADANLYPKTFGYICKQMLAFECINSSLSCISYYLNKRLLNSDFTYRSKISVVID